MWLSLLAVAHAQTAPPVDQPGVRLDPLWATLSTTVVPGAVGDPTLRAGLSALYRPQLGERGDLQLSWGLWREQALCDTCEGGEGPGWLGRELLGSTDLSVATGYRLDLGPAGLRLAAEAVLPASRDALSCNPMYGAPGASATLTVPAGRSAIVTSLRASRPIYRYDAAPVGACAPPLRGQQAVDTLTGAVDPEPWDGSRTARANPTFTTSSMVTWAEPLALLEAAPERLTTRVSVGLTAQRNPVDPATTVDALTGPVAVDASRRPVTAAVPWSLAAGWRASDHLDLMLGVSNQLPTFLADPGGTLRALPSRTALTLSATGHL